MYIDHPTLAERNDRQPPRHLLQEPAGLSGGRALGLAQPRHGQLAVLPGRRAGHGTATIAELSAALHRRAEAPARLRPCGDGDRPAQRREVGRLDPIGPGRLAAQCAYAGTTVSRWRSCSGLKKSRSRSRSSRSRPCARSDLGAGPGVRGRLPLLLPRLRRAGADGASSVRRWRDFEACRPPNRWRWEMPAADLAPLKAAFSRRRPGEAMVAGSDPQQPHLRARSPAGAAATCEGNCVRESYMKRNFLRHVPGGGMAPRAGRPASS